MIHLFGDMWSPEIVGRLADAWGKDLRKGVLLLPFVLLIGGLFWLVLAIKSSARARRTIAAQPVALPN